MNKGKDRSADTSKPVRHARTLGLAVAAASLGMCIGISPGDVLGVSAQTEPTKNSIDSEPQQLAAAFLKIDGVPGESNTGGTPARPGRSIQKAEQPAASFPKVEQPAASFPKVEQPAASFPKVERPGASFPKVEQPAASFPKVEQPAASFPKVERPGASFPKVEY
jgi:hypothetical protein